MGIAATTNSELAQAPASDAAVDSRPWVRRMAGKATRPMRRLAWEYRHVLRHGRPTTLLVYGHGFGDHLLCTAVFRELRLRGNNGLWMMSNNPDLFAGNQDVDAVVPMDWRFPQLAERWGGRSLMPNYAEIIESEDRSVAPKRHIISCMCERAGIMGDISLRPYLNLTGQEKAQGRLAARQIAIQSSILAASMPIPNKEWHAERFQSVVDALRDEFTFVQLGSPRDPKLEGVIDARGKTNVRQAAAILSQSMAFVGLVGFLMHLARSVDCRGVIVFGGREAPWQSGYMCNENIYNALPCSPCWLWSRCEHGHKCMNDIDAKRVIEATRRQVEAAGEPLAVGTDTLSPV